MQIIVLGCGPVGISLAENLAQENHDVTVVSENTSALGELQNRLDIRTVIGRASYPNVLRRAGAEDADIIIAVTDEDEVNMVACQVAYSLFDVPTKIASIRSHHYMIRKQLFGSEDLPIDVFISPESLVIKHINELIEYPGAFQVLDFADGKIKLIGVKPYYGGLLVGKTLLQIKDTLPGVDMRIAAIFREKKSLPLYGDTVIEVGDEVFCIAASEHIPTIISALRRQEKPNKSIIIAGGGRIGSGLAEQIAHDYTITLIDHNEKRCDLLREEIKNVEIVCGDVADSDLLKQIDISHRDMFCAVTNDDEANIMSCMQAKRLGARQVMALIGRPTYVELIEGGTVNIVVSPQQATISSILRYVRCCDVKQVHSLRRGSAEAMEIAVNGSYKESRVVDRLIRELDLPKSIAFGAILRGDNVIIPDGRSRIMSGDRVVVFVSDKKYLNDVEKLFK